MFLLLFLLNTCIADELLPTEVLIQERKASTKIGGSSSTIGGDTTDMRRISTWFYGDKPVKTCITYTANFGLSRTVVVEQTQKALDDWTSYLSQSDKPFSRKINTNFELKANCVGGEDLVLHFGSGPIWGNLRDLRTAQSLSDPVAYVNKTHISKSLSWSKGYLRFVPENYYSSDTGSYPKWTSQSLYTMIAHEMGHVLGFSHVPGTVMDDKIVQKIFFQGESVIGLEQDGRLLYCKECTRIYTSKDRSILRFFKTTKSSIDLKISGRKATIDGNKLTLSETLFSDGQQVIHTNFDSSVRQKRPSISYANWNGNPLIIEYLDESSLRVKHVSGNRLINLGTFHAEPSH